MSRRSRPPQDCQIAAVGGLRCGCWRQSEKIRSQRQMAPSIQLTSSRFEYREVPCNNRQDRTVKDEVRPLGRIFGQIALNALSVDICLMP